MMPAPFHWTDAAVRRALELPDGDSEAGYEGVSTDTRTLRPGELFVALRGDRFDGHDFIAQAVAAGCGGVVGDRGPDDCAVPLYRVPDTLKALGSLALHRRLQTSVPVVGVTGSSGKTTVKELILGALEGSHRAHGTRANRNNRIGTPLTILSMPETATALVLEMGTSEPGEIAELARIARPTVGVVTTVSETHVERLGDLDGVLAEKLDLLRALGGAGAAVVGDEPDVLASEARQVHPRLQVAGWSPRADRDLRPRGARHHSDGSWSFTWMGHPVGLGTPGAHSVYNALLALAVARLLNVPPARAAAGVSRVGPGPMRGEVRRAGGITLLVDCYNANAAGVAAAVTTLEGMSARGRRVAVLGTMLELGARSEMIHTEALARALRAGIDRYVLTGAFANAARQVSDDRIHLVDDVASLAEALPELVGPTDTVLLKASRGVRLERAIPVLESLGGEE